MSRSSCASSPIFTHWECGSKATMQQVIAEHIEPGSGAILAARTFKATAVECLLEGNEIVTGVVKAQTEDGEVLLLVSPDERYFQCARVYDSGGNLIESL